MLNVSACALKQSELHASRLLPRNRQHPDLSGGVGPPAGPPRGGGGRERSMAEDGADVSRFWAPVLRRDGRCREILPISRADRLVRRLLLGQTTAPTNGGAMTHDVRIKVIAALGLVALLASAGCATPYAYDFHLTDPGVHPAAKTRRRGGGRRRGRQGRDLRRCGRRRGLAERHQQDGPGAAGRMGGHHPHAQRRAA